MEDKTNFYLAVKENDSWQYSYKPLGTDISDIFRSFNIALSRIKEYGSRKSDEINHIPTIEQPVLRKYKRNTELRNL